MSVNKEIVDAGGQTDDDQNIITIAHLEHFMHR